jgi:hypothetical protein
VLPFGLPWPASPTSAAIQPVSRFTATPPSFFLFLSWQPKVSGRAEINPVEKVINIASIGIV